MNLAILYLLFIFGGVGVESVISILYFTFKKRNLHTNKFVFARYLYLLTLPLIGTFYMIYIKGTELFNIFLFFIIVGPIFEWLVGFSYYRIVGSRLWTYHKYTFQGHSSLLASPMWGMAGVLFYLISQQIR